MWSFLPIHTEMACGWKIAGEQRLRRLKISEKDLETNDNRITIFDPSKTILMTDSDVLHSECNHLKMEIKQMEREHATEIKTLEKPRMRFSQHQRCKNERRSRYAGACDFQPDIRGLWTNLSPSVDVQKLARSGNQLAR